MVFSWWERKGKAKENYVRKSLSTLNNMKKRREKREISLFALLSLTYKSSYCKMIKVFALTWCFWMNCGFWMRSDSALQLLVSGITFDITSEFWGYSWENGVWGKFCCSPTSNKCGKFFTKKLRNEEKILNFRNLIRAIMLIFLFFGSTGCFC